MELAQKQWAGDGRGDPLHSLVVTIEDMPADSWSLIDVAHPAAKPDAVERGLMLGQFHPACPTPSVHNAGFPVNQAPVPLVVVRPMALHDLLFLHDDPHYFEAYRRHFAHRYAPSTRPPAHLKELYTTALRRHSLDAASDSEPERQHQRVADSSSLST
jgi:heptaprenyl diphosphate synthase